MAGPINLPPLTPQQLQALQANGWPTSAPPPAPPPGPGTPEATIANTLGAQGYQPYVPTSSLPPVAPEATPVGNAHSSPVGFGALPPAATAVPAQVANAIEKAADPTPGVVGTVSAPVVKRAPGPGAAAGTLAGEQPDVASTPVVDRSGGTSGTQGTPTRVTTSGSGAQPKADKPLTATEEYVKVLRDATVQAADRNALVLDATTAKSEAESAKATAQSAAAFEATQQAQTRMADEKQRQDSARQQAESDDADSKARALALAQRKVDPDRLFHDASVPNKIRMVLAAGLGAFGAALTKGPNFALQQINAAIDRDVAAQRDEIQNAKDSDMMLNDISKRKYGRAMTQNELDARSRQDGYNYALHQADVLANSYNSTIATANGALLKGQLGAQAEQQSLSLAHSIYQARLLAEQAAAKKGGGGVDNSKEFRSYVAKFMGDGDSLQVAQARALQLFAPDGRTNIPTLTGTPKQGSGKEISEMEKEQIRSYKQGLGYLYQIRDMVREGGEVSPARTAKGEALTAGAFNAIARAETGGHRAPTPEEIKILERQIPHDPNSWQFSGKELERINTTIAATEAALARLPGQAPSSGQAATDAGVGFSPEKK